ncbi:MAG: dihydroorotase [Thermoprotei archaeon ex4572_64]|nr:MAG: dihydroorotase [Thermoprotei archaeon ex4572_64]
MTSKFIITGKVFNHDKFVRKSIIIDDGKIVDIKDGTYSKSSYRIINLPERFIICQGFVDAHVHCRDFQESHKETLKTCEEAAFAGGVVAIGDMPNTKPRINNLEVLLRRLELAKKLKIIYKVHVGVPEDLSEVEKMVKLGVKSIKIYPEDWVEYGHRHIISLLKLARKYNLIIITHCEDLDMIMYSKYIHDFKFHSKIRCRQAEIVATLSMIKLALKYGFKLHITHTSIPDVIDYVNTIRKYIDVTVDTTPHYVLLSQDECLSRVDVLGYCKVNPPLRDVKDRVRLLNYLTKGYVDFIVSDHAPHSVEEKCSEYSRCPSGFPGLETTLPLLLTLWKSQVLSFRDVLKLYSINPSNFLNVNVNMSISNYAYLIIIDSEKDYVINPEEFKSKAKYSPFINFKVKGRVVATFVKGELVYVHTDYLDLFSTIM